MRVKHGAVPSTLNGAYIMNGTCIDMRSIHKLSMHVFDRPGYIQKIIFNDGIASYTARHVDTPWRPIKAFSGPFIAPLPCFSYNAGNTNIIPYGNKYLALYDGGSPYIIDPIHLTTIGNINNGFVNSHPKRNPDGSLVFLRFSYDFMLHTTIDVIDGNRKVLTMHIPHFVYVHDFFVTESFYGYIDHHCSLDMSPFIHGGIGMRIKSSQKAHTLTLIRKSTSHVSNIPLYLSYKFGTHYVNVVEDITNNVLRISLIMYIDYNKPPGVIVSFCVATSVNPKHLISDLQIINQWCELPNNNVLVHVPNGGISTFNSLPYPHLTRVVDDTDHIYGEVAFDPISQHYMTYAYNHVTEVTTLKIFNSQWNNVCDLAFPQSIVPIGIHGTFMPLKEVDI